LVLKEQVMKKILTLGGLSILVLIATACTSADGPAGVTPTEELTLVEQETPTSTPLPTEAPVLESPTPEPLVLLSEVASVGDLGSVVDVEVSGDIAYLADSFGGLQVLDLSDPEQPSVVSTFDSPGSTRGQGVFVAEPYLYLADGKGVRILDISDPTAPEELGFYDTLGFALDLQVVGDMAYVAAREGGFYIGNFADPANPEHVSRIFDAGTDHVLDVLVSGGYAYVAMEGQGLRIVDVSDPANPAVVGSLDTEGMAEAVDLDGNLLYLADGEAGVKAIDVSDPAAPQQIGAFDTPGYAQDVAKARLEDQLYVSDGSSRFLLVLDVSDPSELVLLTQYETMGFVWGITLSEPLAYLASGERGLLILQIDTE
jgi:hypothetical protein